MSENPFERVTHWEIWSGDLDRFVTDFYEGRPWCLALGEGKNQGTWMIVDVFGEDGTENQTEQECRDLLAEFLSLPAPDRGDWRAVRYWEEARYLPVEIVLWDLNRKGTIPPGTYRINIYW